MSDKLTNQDYEVLYAMNRGMYLIFSSDVEGISKTGYFITQAIKAGTIPKLVRLGLVRSSPASVNRFLLTDEGRKHRQP